MKKITTNKHKVMAIAQTWPSYWTISNFDDVYRFTYFKWRTTTWTYLIVVFLFFNLEFIVLCFVDHCLSLCPFNISNCIVCPLRCKLLMGNIGEDYPHLITDDAMVNQVQPYAIRISQHAFTAMYLCYLSINSFLINLFRSVYACT
jgi:hypothetical protein